MAACRKRRRIIEDVLIYYVKKSGKILVAKKKFKIIFH